MLLLIFGKFLAGFHAGRDLVKVKEKALGQRFDHVFVERGALAQEVLSESTFPCFAAWQDVGFPPGLILPVGFNRESLLFKIGNGKGQGPFLEI